MRHFFIILSLLATFSSAAKNTINNCIWEGIKWHLGSLELTDGKLDANFLKNDFIPIYYDITFVSDYKSQIGNQWYYPILYFLSRPREKSDLEIWAAQKLDKDGKLEHELKFENYHRDLAIGGWEKDNIYMGEYLIDTFTYRHSPKFDTLFIVFKRADISVLIEDDTTTAAPEGNNSIRGVWNFDNSYVFFDGIRPNNSTMAYAELSGALSVDSTQKGIMRTYKKSNNPLSDQSPCNLSMVYWIKDNRLYISDVKKNIIEIPFKLSADGSELYIVLSRSKLSNQHKELIKKNNPLK